MDPISYLTEARKLLFKALQSEIIQTELQTSIYQLKIIFSQGSILFIRYNEFGECGYQLLFTKRKNDFVRFDNFDDKWKVSTKPHHFHSRYDSAVVKSPMIGDPKFDMPEPIKFMKTELFLGINEKK